MSIVDTSARIAQMSDVQLLSAVVGFPVTTRPANLAALCGLCPTNRVSEPIHTEWGALFPESAQFNLDCARELFSRALKESLSRNQTEFSSPNSARTYLQLRLAGKAREVFCVLFMNSQNRLIACEDMFVGTINQSSVYPREVAKRALELNASGLILAHNHPSGSTQPSRADEAMTQSLKTSLAMFDIAVLDHIIVGDGHALSMRETGFM